MVDNPRAVTDLGKSEPEVWVTLEYAGKDQLEQRPVREVQGFEDATRVSGEGQGVVPRYWKTSEAATCSTFGN